MIFTSYFSMIRNFPSNVIPIGISRWEPKWYTGLNDKTVSPSKELLSLYKGDNIDENSYTSAYKEELSKVDLDAFVRRINNAVGYTEDGLPISESKTNHVALLCYEKPDDFCHRHILASILTEKGIPCREITKDELIAMKENEVVDVDRDM